MMKPGLRYACNVNGSCNDAAVAEITVKIKYKRTDGQKNKGYEVKRHYCDSHLAQFNQFYWGPPKAR